MERVEYIPFTAVEECVVRDGDLSFAHGTGRGC